MKVIVFGGSGFLGSHVADALSKSGHEVTIFDIKQSSHLKQNQKMIIGDILDQVAVEAAVAGMDLVYHFAGIADIKEAFEKRREAIQYNILGTLNLLEASRLGKIKRFIFASTVYVCSNSGSIYRTTKRACESLIEDYLKAFDLEYTILRYGSLYGARAGMNNSVYRLIYQTIKEENLIEFSANPDDERKYIHVEDAAIMSVDILDEKYKNQRLILTGKESIKVSDLFAVIKQMVGKEIKIKYRSPDQNFHYNKHYDDQLQLLAGKEIYAGRNLNDQLSMLVEKIQEREIKKIKKLKAIIFDFDGVILESVDIKTKAFAKLFADYPEHIDDIIKLHLDNGGMSRFKKFEIIYRDFFKKPLSESKSRELGGQFSKIVFDEVLRCSFVKGAKQLLDKHLECYDFYIVSGTPEDEIRSIVEKRGLGCYFKKVYGSPASKGNLIGKILKDEALIPDEVVFIGDSINDYKGAKEAGVKFIARKLSPKISTFDGLDNYAIVDDLEQFDHILCEERSAK